MIKFYEAPDGKAINLKEYNISIQENTITFESHDSKDYLQYSYESNEVAKQHFKNIKNVLIQ